MRLNRRQMLFAAGATVLGARPMTRLFAAPQGPTKRILFFTKSSGFQHSVVTRKGDQPSLCERILTEIGKQHGYDVVASKDGRMFDPDKIGQWDGFAFITTGDLTKEGTDKQPPMSADGKKAFLDAIHSGKGFIGMHCASDTFHSQGDQIDPYVKMIGGEFSGHDAQQVAKIQIVDDAFPGIKAFGSGAFELNDEWYAQRNLGDDLHVILVQTTEGMKGPNYQRPNYPETWSRMHGKGRVFYTSMGHREDVWENPKYQGLLIGALDWVTGKAEANVEPNISRVTPGYKHVAERRSR